MVKNILVLNKIYNIDCMYGVKQLENNSIDLVVTSHPYYNAKEYSHWEKYQDYTEWLRNIFSLIYEKLKEGRMCCVNLSVILEPRKNRNSESKRIPLPFHFVNIMENIGFKFLEDIIWVKPEGAAKNRNGRFFQDRQPVQYKPNVVNEYVLIFQKPSRFLIDKIVRSYNGDIKKNSLVGDGYERSNVWHINPETKSKHPAPFPEELCDKLIKYYSYINDIIFDPFMGSGTTGKMALLNNRKFIGFEINEKYYEMSEKRISEYIT